MELLGVVTDPPKAFLWNPSFEFIYVDFHPRIALLKDFNYHIFFKLRDRMRLGIPLVQQRVILYDYGRVPSGDHVFMHPAFRVV